MMLTQCNTSEEAPLATRVCVLASNDDEFMTHLWLFSTHVLLWTNNINLYHHMDFL